MIITYGGKGIVVELKANYHIVLHSVAGACVVWCSIFSKLLKKLQKTKPISWYCYFEWHNLFFCKILLEFIIGFNNAFSGLFFCKQKGARVFQWQEDINIVWIIALSSTKPCVSFLKFLIFSQPNQPNYWRNSDKSLFSWTRQFKRNLRHGFVRERVLKAIMLI